MGRATRKGVLLVALLALVGGLHARMPTRARASQGELFVPRPEVARASALGFDAVIGDYYWLQAVQLVGSELHPERKGDLLAALIDVVTTLDPWVDHPYRFAAVWLTHDEASVRKANALLRRGIAHHPGEWRNPFYLGFNHFYYLGEPAEAAEALERAMRLPGAPAYLRRLVARLRGAGGSLEVAESFLHAMILEAEGEEEREAYRGALLELAAERVARQLDEARRRYRERNGRDIEAATDLARGPGAVLRELPAEPHGGAWVLDPDDGRIVSDVVGYRFEAKIDLTNRRRLREFQARSRERGTGREGGEG